MFKPICCEKEQKVHLPEETAVCIPSETQLHTTQEAVTNLSCKILAWEHTAIPENDKDLRWFTDTLRETRRDEGFDLSSLCPQIRSAELIHGVVRIF